MNKIRLHAYTILGLSLVISLAVAAMISCGGSSMSSNSPTTGTVQTFLSDPPTCSAEFDHVYVTITKVEANISATSNSGWQTLVDLTSTPQQVDLLSLNPTATAGFCGTLFMLGKKALPPGKYQQIRLILMDNTGTVSGDKCSTGVNCVVPHNNTTTYELQLSSQAQTGIKIPSSQIANGGLTVSAGQSVDFNIDFDTCASIVQEGNGQYRFKPVLHAGEISMNGANTISGKVVEGAGSPNPGMGVGDAIVLLEQPDSTTPTPVDRVIWSGTTNPDGTFAFCPVAPTSSSNFDVVVAGSTTQTIATVTTTTTYNPSVVFNVPIGGSAGNIPVFAETTTGSGTGLVSTSPATISGQITTADNSSPSKPISGEVQLSALQSATNPQPPAGSPSTVLLTIPVLDAGSTPGGHATDSQPPVYTTVTNTSSSSPAGCATTSFDCVGYSVMVPASAVAIGTYDSTNGNSMTAPSSTSQAMYTIEGLANGTNGLLNCTSPTNGDAMSHSVTVTSGSAISSSGTTPSESTLDLTFSGCTAP